MADKKVQAAADKTRAVINQVTRNAKLRGAGSTIPPASNTYGLDPLPDVGYRGPGTHDLLQRGPVDPNSFQPIPNHRIGEPLQIQLLADQGIYVPAGMQGPAMVPPRTGVPSSVVTGDPQVDVNTDFGALRQRYNDTARNDEAFTASNMDHLGAIAKQRQIDEAVRANRLLNGANGLPPLDQSEVAVRMNPHQYTTDVAGGMQVPPDVRAEQNRIKAIDAAERMGRSNLHAMAARYIRNGVPPAMAYQMAQTQTPTTNPNNQGLVPSLPAIDPYRAVVANPGTAYGMVGIGHNDVAAQNGQLQYGLGIHQSDNTLRGQMGANDVSLAQALLQRQTAQDQNQTARDLGGVGSNMQQKMALAWLQANPQAYMSPNPAIQQLYHQMAAQAAGQTTQPQGATPAPQPGAQPAPAQSIQYAPQSLDPKAMAQMRVNDPQAMAFYLNSIQDPNQRARAEVDQYVQAGQGGHPVVQNYVNNTLRQQDPNVMWGPDSMYGSGGAMALGTYLTPMFGPAMGASAMAMGQDMQDARAAELARYLESQHGIPAAVALPHVKAHLQYQ